MSEDQKLPNESIPFLPRSEQEYMLIPKSALRMGTEVLREEIKRVQDRSR